MVIEAIPPMIDPLGRYWDQPKREEIAVDHSAAMMSSATFSKLHEYSGSLPSGKYEGKMWRLNRGGVWYLRWYQADPNDPNMLLIPVRPIVIVD